MRAVRLTQLGASLEEGDVPLPEIGPSDVLVRVAACGICHSDAHYRGGISPIDSLPVTPGHEVAGRIETVGNEVRNLHPGTRVCLHYLVTCGKCHFCVRGEEQFCVGAQMIGKHRDGGYAEFIRIPARNVFVVPDEIPFDVAAIMMCSSATSLHALNKTRLKAGESVAIFGFGGLGFSALQLARAFDCGQVFVVDLNQSKLQTAAALGAVPINAGAGDPVQQINDATHGRGVDVSLELIGSAVTMNQAVKCLGIRGRAAIAGLTNQSMSIQPYTEIINKEAEIIGVSDHLASELPLLIELARAGKLDFPEGTIRHVKLEAVAINSVLDALEKSTDQIRSVIVP